MATAGSEWDLDRLTMMPILVEAEQVFGGAEVEFEVVEDGEDGAGGGGGGGGFLEVFGAFGYRCFVHHDGRFGECVRGEAKEGWDG